MSSFGESLRKEREERNTTLEDICAATGIEVTFLEALESNDFRALPGRAFGKLYIRAYAATLGIDPRPLIELYERQHELIRRAASASPVSQPAPVRPVEDAISRWRQETMAARQMAGDFTTHAAASTVTLPIPQAPESVPTVPAAPLPEAIAVAAAAALESVPYSAAAALPPEREGVGRWSRRAIAALIFLGLFMGAAGAYVTFRRNRVEASAPEVPIVEPPPVESAAPPPPEPSPEEAPPRADRITKAPSSDLEVPEHGVGTRVLRRSLIGENDSFPLEDIVWFSTRVVGGAPGQTIRHVWIHEGRVVQTIDLDLGGPDWRTHSRKTLRDTGEWVVEARDAAGRVLARSIFTCTSGDSDAPSSRRP